MCSKYDKENLEKIVSESYSIAECLRKLGIEPVGGNYKTFYRYKNEYDLDTSHFKNLCYENLKKSKNEKDINAYLKENIYVKPSVLLKKLIKFNLKEYKCECCGITEWNGENITLQLHHIDGNSYNNTLENLKILCPNCHSQTDNFCGKNIKKNELKCENCGKKLKWKNKNGLCSKCYHEKTRKVERPSKEMLFELLKENSFSKVGRMYGVSDNMIKKWCKYYKIPYKSKSYKSPD